MESSKNKERKKHTKKVWCAWCSSKISDNDNKVVMTCGHVFHIECFQINSSFKCTTCLLCVPCDDILDRNVKNNEEMKTLINFGNNPNTVKVVTSRCIINDIIENDTISNKNLGKSFKSKTGIHVVQMPIDEKSTITMSIASLLSPLPINEDEDENSNNTKTKSKRKKNVKATEKSEPQRDYIFDVDDLDFKSALKRGVSVDVLARLGLNSVSVLTHNISIFDFVKNGYTFDDLIVLGIKWNDATDMGLCSVDAFNKCKSKLPVEKMVTIWNISYIDLIDCICNDKVKLFLNLDLTKDELKLLKTSIMGLHKRGLKRSELTSYKIVKIDEWNEICPKDVWPFDLN